jgi:hypothetical protein
MADVTRSSGSFIRPYRSPWGAFPNQTRKSISSATIHAGQIITLDFTGSTNVKRVVGSTNVAHLYCVGVAASSRTGSTTVESELPIWEANPNVEFRAHCLSAGALASSLVGLRKSLMVDSTLNITGGDLADSTNTNYRVLITDVLGTEGDTGGEVAFKFIRSYDGNVGSSVGSTAVILAFAG